MNYVYVCVYYDCRACVEQLCGDCFRPLYMMNEWIYESMNVFVKQIETLTCQLNLPRDRIKIFNKELKYEHWVKETDRFGVSEDFLMTDLCVSSWWKWFVETVVWDVLWKMSRVIDVKMVI